MSNQDTQLSELQMSVMQILWSEHEATAAEVHDKLTDRDLAFTTVATILSRLEKRGLVNHRKEGRQYVYSPKIEEKTVRHSMVRDLVQRVFKGNPTALLNHLLKEQDFTNEDLKTVKKLISEAEKSQEGSDD